ARGFFLAFLHVLTNTTANPFDARGLAIAEAIRADSARVRPTDRLASDLSPCLMASVGPLTSFCAPRQPLLFDLGGFRRAFLLSPQTLPPFTRLQEQEARPPRPVAPASLPGGAGAALAAIELPRHEHERRGPRLPPTGDPGCQRLRQRQQPFHRELRQQHSHGRGPRRQRFHLRQLW